MDKLEKQLMEITSNGKNASLSLIPGYLTILSTLDGAELSNALKHYLVASAISGASISGLRLLVVKLCAQEKLQEHVLSGLWDGKDISLRCTNSTKHKHKSLVIKSSIKYKEY